MRVGDDALLGSPEQGSEILAFTLNRTTVATCALVSGVADKALRLTAQYTTERKQFDRAIGTFQAVGQRMADCYIDNQAIELTMLQAATHLDEGRDDPLEVATAKFWAADGGNRIAHAALHIHGGVSIDVDFPIHRYFLWLKRYEFTLGSATPELLRIGEVLADTPVAADCSRALRPPACPRSSTAASRIRSRFRAPGRYSRESGAGSFRAGVGALRCRGGFQPAPPAIGSFIAGRGARVVVALALHGGRRRRRRAAIAVRPASARGARASVTARVPSDASRRSAGRAPRPADSRPAPRRRRRVRRRRAAGADAANGAASPVARRRPVAIPRPCTSSAADDTAEHDADDVTAPTPPRRPLTAADRRRPRRPRVPDDDRRHDARSGRSHGRASTTGRTTSTAHEARPEATATRAVRQSRAAAQESLRPVRGRTAGRPSR